METHIHPTVAVDYNGALLQKLKELSPWIGNTPLKKLSFPHCNLYAKLEFFNHSGSVKDRAAYYILLKAIEEGLIHPDTVIVESSSGNFALALASICKQLGLTFIPVIDPNINRDYEKVLHLLCDKVVKVEQRDLTGGYLLTRIEMVKEICGRYPGSFWTNQYGNENNFRAYYESLGLEIGAHFERLDYLFVAVSSCGTITGLSMRLKELFPHIRIIAVDVEGSVIFGTPPAPRHVSGIGASKVPDILQYAIVDEVMHVSEPDLISGCYQLLEEQLILGGGSSGTVYFAVKEFFRSHAADPAANVLFITPDSGKAYLDTIYNPQWEKMITEKKQLHQ